MVELCGTVTSLDSYVDKFHLTLDDSTDIITCVLWSSHSSNSKHRTKVEATLLSRNKVVLGDIVRIRGKIRLLRQDTPWASTEISIHGIHKESDLNMESLHALEVMTLDTRYRLPFEPEAAISKLAKGVTSFEQVLKSCLGIGGLLKMSELQPAVEIGAPRNTLALFIPPFSAQSLLQNDAIAINAQRLADKTKQRPESIVKDRLDSLLAAGEILYDPTCDVLAYCQEAAMRTGTTELFVDSSLCYTQEGLPNKETPFVLWTADLLVPVVYESLRNVYLQKLELQTETSLKFWFGASLAKIVEQLHSLAPPFAKIPTSKVLLAINVLIQLNLAYEVEALEFRPVNPEALIDLNEYNQDSL